MKRLVAFFMLVLIALSVLPGAALAGQTNEPVVMKYSVVNGTGQAKASIKKGETVTLLVSVKDTSLTTNELGGVDNLDITKLVDGFSGGSVGVNITSGDTELLTYDITFTNVTYGGAGKLLRFMIGYKLVNNPFVTMELSVSEAIEYEPPKEPDPLPPTAPDAIPQPVVVVSWGEIKQPIQAGQRMDMEVTFENHGNRQLTSPVVTFSPSDSILIEGGRTSFVLEDIPRKDKKTITVSIRAADTISSATQSLGVDFKFNYHNDVSVTQGTVSDRISIPVTVKTVHKNSQPTVIVTRSALNPISANQVFDLTLNIKNAGNVKIENPVASVALADALVLQNDTSTYVLGTIEPGMSAELRLHIKAGKELSSSTQSVNLDLKFSYDAGEETVQANISERLNLSANVTEAKNDAAKMDSAVPNVIISSFDYGGDSVSAGSKFPLDFTFKNTGKLKIENIVVTVDGGESFTMDGSTNTFYYDKLDAGAEQKQLVNMQALAAAKTGAQTTSISFKYEYVDGSKRATASADIKLSIPVFQPDRFQINAPVIPETVNAGEEVSLSLSYVNKGKAEVRNVEATIDGDVEALATTQYLGNFESGKSGTIGFVFTPQSTGETKISLKISYEDANQQLQSVSFPITLNVQKPFEEISDPGMEFPEDGAKPHISIWLWIAGGALLFAAALVAVKLAKKKKSAKPDNAGWESWSDTAEETTDKADTHQEGEQ